MTTKRWKILVGLLLAVAFFWMLAPKMEAPNGKVDQSAEVLAYSYTDTQALAGVYKAIEENENPVDRLTNIRWVTLQTYPSEIIGQAYLEELIDMGLHYQPETNRTTEEGKYVTYSKVFYVKEMALQFNMPGAYEYANLWDVYLSSHLKDEQPMTAGEFEQKLADYLTLVTDKTSEEITGATE